MAKLKITAVKICNFKSIKELSISGVSDVLILVGKNNAGKSSVMDAIRAALGGFEINKNHFNRPGNITVKMTLAYDEKDLENFHAWGVVSKYKDYGKWLADFQKKLPSFSNNSLTFEYIYTEKGEIRYKDCNNKNNPYIKLVLPKIYFIDHLRNDTQIQNEILMFQGNANISKLRADKCLFDNTRNCNQCFNCIGMINKKSPETLNVMETARLFQYKLFSLNLNNFAKRLNQYFSKNGGQSQTVRYEMKFDIDEVLKIETTVKNKETGRVNEIESLSEGYKSIYMLSLLEAYIDEKNRAPYIIMIEDPEIYLHPQLQKVASEILYRLSNKNQVIFSTHSPNMIFNFTTKQIRQVMLDKEYNTIINPKTDIDDILNDLGYTANDLMNVSFVFFVEGKQDRSRLPLLLEKYYSEIYDDNNKLFRISIISTNSCTNIKTYANLKYINQLYIKDQFLMIRDGDGKDREELIGQLCKYYEKSNAVDAGYLPRVTRKNVLVLKYYSFENYFLDPKVMAQIGVINSEEEFYDILYAKYKEYLYKLTSVKKMLKAENLVIKSKEDLKDNLENIKIYVRGHNLYDIFYGRYKGEKEINILKQYIAVAPRNNFADILDSVDKFVYFCTRKR